jgi:hypothetical protein
VLGEVCKLAWQLLLLHHQVYLLLSLLWLIVPAAIPPSVQSALQANPRDPAAMAEAAKVLKDNPEMLKMAADMFDKLSPGEWRKELLPLMLRMLMAINLNVIAPLHCIEPMTKCKAGENCLMRQPCQPCVPLCTPVASG